MSHPKVTDLSTQRRSLSHSIFYSYAATFGYDNISLEYSPRTIIVDEGHVEQNAFIYRGRALISFIGAIF